ncbi:APC family permease [Leptothoe spongobia]|uniref:Amino acid permease n=1 Tax=Leptothoe spongobia TAU-MAC 1115 TaxID=1967444 RepID=A0A947GGK9_9CYAN|nr:amino acid permease [Leptothoe spongobia]MBT9314203.1 amino acid permease [Leptothoe spongobia TAU-MAC 1115]
MTSRSSESSSKVIETSPTGLGTFGGVFTPSILTILGVIMYLRFGWVVGQMGLVKTLLIVTISTAITFITGLSISAIATDQVVRAGGAYYMISRSLGLETGGAVGIPLYFAQAFSVALYTIGFAESVANAFPNLPITVTVMALGTTITITALALKSADIAIKAQYVIMAAIILSLLSLAFGSHAPPTELPLPEDAGKVSFWAVLAVFFPAVTGIMSGVNMSGDLKDPKKAIPMGTLAAVGVGYAIYMIIPILLINRADNASLLADPLIMRKMAFWGGAILLGVWGATLSSALGSILGAPRVLQALARDNILPKRLRWLGNGHGPADEPRLGTLFTLGVVLAVVCIGDLDAIAPVLTMFFLTTYMVLNVAAGIEGFLQSPSFRPTFRIPWYISLLGALGCIAIMFLINPAATVAAALIVLIIYLWLERREIRTTWGDVRQGIWLSLVRAGLNNIADSADPKNWRPHLLVLSGAPTKRWHLIELATDFTHNRGLITVASILPTGARNLKQQEQMRSTIRDYLEKRGIQAFVKLIEANDTSTGARQLIDTYGIGPLRPNTVLLGDTETDDHEARERYCQIISKCHQAKRNIIILRNPPNQMPQFPQRIDVWWGGLQSNGGLMLILAYLLRTGMRWRSTDIYIKLVVSNQAAAQAAQTNLNKLLETLSIGAQSNIIVAEDRPFDTILRKSSATADLILMGLATPDEGFADYYTSLQQKTIGLPPTIFVLAAEDLAFSELLQKD